MSRTRRKIISLKQQFLTSENHLRLVARIASIMAILVGCLVLIGWSLDIAFLKSVIPEAATLKANSALGFILAGISLGLQTRRRQTAWITRLAQGFAIAVCIIGLLNLWQYLFNWNLGIDELLFKDRPISPNTDYPGRMGDNTALNFALTGLALWLNGQRTRRSYYVAQSATLITALIALLAVVGYVYNVEVFYRFIFYSSSMAIHTAVTFLVLCVGILSLQGNQGWMQIVTSNSFGGIIARQLIPAALGMPLILGWLIRQGQLAGWYDYNFELSLMVISLIVILLGLIGRSAAIINKIDGDRKRSDERLRSSEERLKLALTGANQGIWDWDLKTKVLTWDDRCKKIFGLPPGFPVTYEWHLDALHPDDRERVFQAKRFAISDRTEFHEEYRTFYPDGTMRWILGRGRGYYDATGEPQRISGIVMDISDRKQAQLNDRFLKELDLRLRQLSDAKAMIWETVSSIGEYLNVDRCFWHEVDWENRLAIIERNWRRADVTDLAGTYSLENFFTSEQFDRLAAGRPIIVPDVTTNSDTAPYAQSYQPLAVAAFVAIPCIQSGRWVANLSINCTTVRNWRDDEVSLLQETVARLWSIIEHTQAIQALRASEYQYRTLFETIDQGFCVCQMLFDENGEPKDYRFLEVNLVFEQMTGLQQATGKTALELVPNLENFWMQIYGEVVLTGEAVRFEHQSKAMNRWFEVSAFRFDEAQNHKFAVLFTNITARKQAEADLQQRNQHIQILYETTRDLLSSYQPLALVDALFDKLKPLMELDIYFNYIVDEQQQKLHLMFSGGIADEMAQEIEWLEIGQAICGTVAQQRCQIVQPNVQQSTDPKTELVRSLGLTAYSCQPLVSQGKLFGTLGFGSLTRTEFTPAETQLFQAICDRIAIAMERSELISSLQQQTEELTRVNRLKDEFLAALSHELRTPLNPILGWTKLLQAQNLTTVKSKEALSTIERNVKQQIALVDDLLDISRVVQGQFQLSSQTVDLVAILKAADDSVRFAAIAKSLTLEFHYSADSITRVMGDELRLQQVFWNLLANAVKFTPDGGRIDVWLEKVQNTAQISITDTGIGIDPEFLPHVFDRFRQADGSSTRRYGGLGLGLALVKHLVELHGGTVEAASLGEGQGATFKVNLPLLRQASFNSSNSKETSSPQQPQTDLSSFTSASLTGIRVLVVDDEPDNLNLLEFVLTQEGAIVTTVISPVEAFKIIAENPPDILISDIGMPEMNGYELLQQVRALPSQQDKPIKAIALTAFAQQEDEDKAIQAGFQAYLSKPLNLVDLVTAIVKQVDFD